MFRAKKKGYRVERKIRLLLEENKWKVVRAGASLGEADLVCIKKGNCILLQIKSTRKKAFYYYDYMQKKLEGIPFFVVVDFGYGNVRIVAPKSKIEKGDGESLKNFLRRL